MSEEWGCRSWDVFFPGSESQLLEVWEDWMKQGEFPITLRVNEGPFAEMAEKIEDESYYQYLLRAFENRATVVMPTVHGLASVDDYHCSWLKIGDRRVWPKKQTYYPEIY